VQLQSNGAITVVVQDPNETRTFSQGITPAAMTDPIGVVECAPLYLFKEVSITAKKQDRIRKSNRENQTDFR